MLARTLVFALKTLIVWIALLLGSILGRMLAGDFGIAPDPDDGPLSPGAAFLLVSALHAVVLCTLAAHANIRGVRLGLFVFAVLFCTQTLMMQIETVFFGAHVGMPGALILRIVFAAAVAALLASAVTAVLFRPIVDAHVKANPTAARLIALAILHVCLYLGAGYFIAWQHPALRAYYAEGLNIALLPLISVQLLRGLLWTLLAWFMVRTLTGPSPRIVALVAVSFSLFGALQLLYPNPYMRWPVRMPHLIEIALGNALFGAIAASLLLRPPRTW